MGLKFSGSAEIRRWRQQLLACLPSSVASYVNARTLPYILDVSGEDAVLYRGGKQLARFSLRDDLVEPSMVALLKPHEFPLALFVPGDWILTRTVVLPIAAKENLRQVLGFELDRLTPFSAEQVYFDYHLGRSGNDVDSLSVEVALVPRKRVNTWLDALRGAGIIVDALSAENLWQDANLLPPEQRPGLNLKRLLRRSIPVVLIVALLGGAMGLSLWQKREIAIALKSREAELSSKASKIMGLRERIAREMESLKNIRDHWQKSPPALDVLQVLTNLLPDDTSLQRMEIKDDVLTINGTSSSASSLIGLLQNSPAFDAPHFLSPVTQQRGKEVFNLSATISMPFPREEVGKQPEVKSKKTDNVDNRDKPAPVQQPVSPQPSAPRSQEKEMASEAPRGTSASGASPAIGFSKPLQRPASVASSNSRTGARMLSGAKQ